TPYTTLFRSRRTRGPPAASPLRRTGGPAAAFDAAHPSSERKSWGFSSLHDAFLHKAVDFLPAKAHLLENFDGVFPPPGSRRHGISLPLVAGGQKPAVGHHLNSLRRMIQREKVLPLPGLGGADGFGKGEDRRETAVGLLADADPLFQISAPKQFRHFPVQSARVIGGRKAPVPPFRTAHRV